VFSVDRRRFQQTLQAKVATTEMVQNARRAKLARLQYRRERRHTPSSVAGMRTPRALARSRPSPVRARINVRSNSASLQDGELAVRRRGVGPCVLERSEAGAGAFDGFEDVEQVLTGGSAAGTAAPARGLAKN
jgi:hypothetical protein